MRPSSYEEVAYEQHGATGPRADEVPPGKVRVYDKNANAYVLMDDRPSDRPIFTDYQSEDHYTMCTGWADSRQQRQGLAVAVVVLIAIIVLWIFVR